MNDRKYRVAFYMDSNYQVLVDVTMYKEVDDYYTDDIQEECVFIGSLSDCEAYIRLHENGYM